MSTSFHHEKDISFVFNVIKQSTNHQHHTDMNSTTKQWWLDNLKYVALQMFDAEGNIVIFCKRGRSRSPIYLVAYLIIIYNMCPADAQNVVRESLLEQRAEILDRYDCLTPFIHCIYQNKNTMDE